MYLPQTHGPCHVIKRNNSLYRGRKFTSDSPQLKSTFNRREVCPLNKCRVGVSNSNCSVGHMSTYKVTRGPHYDADATMAVPELTRNSLYLIFCERYHELQTNHF